MKSTKQRTSKRKLSKKNSAPRWVIGVVLAIVVATGAFLVYNSYASGGPTIRTIYCGQGRCSDVRVEPSWQPKSAYTRYNSRCNFGQTEYREVGSPKSSWNCLWVFV